MAFQLRDEALERNSRDNISVMVPTPRHKSVCVVRIFPDPFDHFPNSMHRAKTAVEKPDEHLMMMHHLFQMCILQNLLVGVGSAPSPDRATPD